MIALVDCNNFYASCERLFQPELIGKPLIVLSNNDGCVIARSDEAKKLGIEMGAPAFMMQEFLSSNHVQVFSSNYTLYGDISHRIFKTLETFTPMIECYSIDEAFLDFSPPHNTVLFDYGKIIKNAIHNSIGLPVSVGIAPSKALAKMANRYAKKMCLNDGVFVADSEKAINELLAWTHIGDVWGIGAQHSRRLGWMGIKTAADFVHKLSPEWVRNNMTVMGERLLNELKGVPAIQWEDTVKVKKGICTARSFGRLLSEKKDIGEAVANYAASCAEKLREQNTCADTIQVLLQTNVHRATDRQYSRNITLQMPMSTNSTKQIIAFALRGLDIIYKTGYHFKKAGVIVSSIIPYTQVQQSLFGNQPQDRKENQVMKMLDSVNNRFGRNSVRFAVQGYSKKLKLRQLHLSPCYTTNIKQVRLIKI